MVDVSAALETESANGKEPLVGAVSRERLVRPKGEHCSAPALVP